MKYIVGLFVFGFLAAAFAGTTCIPGTGQSGTPFICTTTPAEASEQGQSGCVNNCVVGEDPFPWAKSGWHNYERSKAYNIAFNHAVAECSANELVIDQNQISVTYGWVPLQGGNHTAHISYYCKDRPPNYAKRWINEMWGPYNCNPGVALIRAEDVADAACATQLRPPGSWFLGDYEITGVSQPSSGECGSSGWGNNPQYKYKLLPQCWRNMNQR